MDLMERCEKALEDIEKEDIEVRSEAYAEMMRLCDEGVEHPTPYRIVAGMFSEGKPAECWRQVIQALVRWLELSDFNDEALEDAYYVCMEAALGCQKAGEDHGTAMCAIQSVRFWAGLEEGEMPDHILGMLKTAVRIAVNETGEDNYVPLEYLSDTCEALDFDLERYLKNEYGLD